MFLIKNVYCTAVGSQAYVYNLCFSSARIQYIIGCMVIVWLDYWRLKEIIDSQDFTSSYMIYTLLLQLTGITDNISWFLLRVSEDHQKSVDYNVR